MGEYMLEIRGVTKAFPGVKALDNVSFNVTRGKIHALLGENGAGKSTLIKILDGIYHADGGEVIFDGRPVAFKTPREAQECGVGVVHQEIKLSGTLTVAENIFLGNLLYKYRGKYVVDWKAMQRRARSMLDELQMNDVDENAVVDSLPISKQQVVEICKTLNLNSRLLIFDEPSASLTEKEIEVLFRIVNQLKAQGITIIYISHRMDEIFQLADEVTVLRDGKHVFTGGIDEVTRESLIAMMVNRNLTDTYPKAQIELGEVVLEAQGLCNSLIHDVSFQLRRGEILGFSGLMGAGRTETMRALLGIDPCRSGKVLLHGKDVGRRTFASSIAKGIGLVPEDRRGQGIVGVAPIRENISMVDFKKITKTGFVNDHLERKYAQEYVQKLNVAAPSIETEIQYLSGGNQQKVVIAKWLYRDSEIFIFDEPTRGIDVGAKYEIYQLMSRLVAAGKSIIMISSELPELLGMSDRILVMNGGRIVGEFDQAEASQERILALCV